MSSSSKASPLADPQNAIADYLDALLQEVPDEEPPAPTLEARLPEVLPTFQPAPEVVPEVVQAPVKSPDLPQTQVVEAALSESPIAAEGFTADDMEGELPCLLFDVSGLTLAVPLVHLSGIANWPEDVTSLPGKPDWYMGLTEYRDSQASVIDTARIVLPSHQYQALAQEGRAWSNIVYIDDGDWGLACHGVHEVVTLSRDDIKWRGSRGTRPWLAGTVIEQMCALLDITEFVRMLGSVRPD